MRILIVDDEPIIRMDLREILEKEGYNVIGEAADGFDAVEFCKKEKPSMVIMDVKMPFMNGLAAAKEITTQKLAETIVLLTAYCDKAFIEEAKKCGVSGYLVKPIDERAFIPALEIAAERGRELQALKKENASIAKKMDERKIVERAKGLIMKSQNLSEQEAYDYIRNMSRLKNVSMIKIAEVIMRQGEV